jgi:hypothetical protein
MAPGGCSTTEAYAVGNYVSIYPYFDTTEERKRLSIKRSRQEFFEIHLPMLMAYYQLRAYIELCAAVRLLPEFCNRRTVKSTCPPSQRSVRGGRRK